MKVIIHRGSHQVGGIAVEFRTDKARIIIDMGDELSLDPDFVSAPLNVPGVTDSNGVCDAVLFTHYHGDHVGQVMRIRKEIPLYAGALAKDVMLKSTERKQPLDSAFYDKIKKVNTFSGGDVLKFGDIQVTPYSIDHSACDSYMFLIEAEGKRIIYTGDFRTHGFRGKVLHKILRKIGKVDVLVTEGTTLSRPDTIPMTEHELQLKAKEYMAKYKYVYVMCASTNLERICALSKAVPRGKYFVCDKYQKELLELVEKHWAQYSPLYRNIKKVTYGDNLLKSMRDRGFLMVVRDNREFRETIKKFDSKESIMLYSMWDGYRTKLGSTIPSFLNLAGAWETLHTSGHATKEDIKLVMDIVKPNVVIPMHTDVPDVLLSLCPSDKVIIAEDGKEIVI